MIQYKNYLCLLILLAIIGCKETETVNPQNNPTNSLPPTTTATVIAGNTQFAIDIYKEVVDEDKNQMLSPYSISSALAMVYAGTDNNTSVEMQNVLGFGANNSNFHQTFNQLSNTVENTINSAQDNEINIINKIWRHNNFHFLPSFENIMTNDYSAPVVSANFKQKEATRQAINSWVDQETNQLIPELLPNGFITNQTVSVLVNAIYFKADWFQHFNPNTTQQLPFTTNAGTTVNTDMMTAEIPRDHTKFTEDSDVEILELFFEDKKSSILLVLPKDQTMGINNFVHQVLSKNRVDQWLNDLAMPTPNGLVDVSIPKWKFNTDFKLKNPLKSLGIKDAFSAACDLSKMAEAPLFIEEVIHKTAITVKEEGIEASAATAVSIGLVGSVTPPYVIKTFTADRPFVFMVKDTETNSILFIGHVQDPS